MHSKRVICPAFQYILLILKSCLVRYYLWFCIVPVMFFIGIGSLPSAPLVSARNCESCRNESNTASTRASIISFVRTA